MNLNQLELIDEGLWALQSDDPKQLDVAIEGDDEAPYPRAKKLAQEILRKSKRYVSLSRDYLEVFIDPRTFDSDGHWHAEAFVFEDGDESFEIHLTLSDDPGLWTVMFYCAQTDNEELETQPVKFAREQV